jgi:curved DNA-binding protein CbpA
MTPQNSFETKGSLRAHPVAELIVEIVHAGLSGSLRLECGSKKTIGYFKEGELVYAVSNARSLRLFNILLEKGLVDQRILSQFPAFTNDFELASGLKSQFLVSRKELEDAVVAQIEATVSDALAWFEGEWVFSPLAQPRKDLCHEIDINRLLFGHARNVPSQIISQRFSSACETFAGIHGRTLDLPFQAHETHILSQFADAPLTIEQLRPICGIAEGGLLQALYVLWLSGALERRNWNAALSDTKIAEIRKAKLTLIKEAANFDTRVAEPEAVETQPDPQLPSEPEPDKTEFELSLEDYLTQVENAPTLYHVLALDPKVPVADIKSRYFAMAKLFHPDRYHREPPETLRRIQVAFTELAHAYETLKNTESRESYDFKMRKELEKGTRTKAEMKDPSSLAERTQELALDSFEKGLSYLADEDYTVAAGFLARAVHYSPQNALYHAYYGNALAAADAKQRHKAEAEMQTAARLDPKNAKIRIMLAEFFIEMNMIKRAEGELRRFLELAPNNKEAQDLLDSLSVSSH